METYLISGTLILRGKNVPGLERQRNIVRILGGEDADVTSVLASRKLRVILATTVDQDPDYPGRPRPRGAAAKPRSDFFVPDAPAPEVVSEVALDPVRSESTTKHLLWSFRDNFAVPDSTDDRTRNLRFEFADLHSDDFLFRAEGEIPLADTGGDQDEVELEANPDAGVEDLDQIQGTLLVNVIQTTTQEEILTQGVEAVTNVAQNLSEIIRKGVEGIERADAVQSTERNVRLNRSAAQPTLDQALWVAIRQRTNNLGFTHYRRFVNRVFCVRNGPGDEDEDEAIDRLRTRDLQAGRNFSNVYLSNVDAYQLLKVATDAFLLINACGEVVIDTDDYNDDILQEIIRLNTATNADEIQQRLTDYLGSPAHLPYLKRILATLNELETFRRNAPDDAFDTGACEGLVLTKNDLCMLELIWSYWLEEGMLVQTMNAVSMRFQNRRHGKRDPLAELAVDPLRPLGNLLWGYVQDEQHRLSVARRVYEYDHHYGLKLIGKAVPSVKSVDSRSKFIEAFHNLLYLASVFYQEDDDATLIPDAYRLLKGLIDVHLLLAQGAHNQFGDLPWTARSEMLVMQWLLQRTEMREFLRGRTMVPHQEAWMGTVAAMRRLQGWSDTPIKHFRDLAVYGEQLLLTIRYGDWIDVIDQEQAKNWARYWRPEIQGYLYAYQAVTGVDLAADQTTVRADVRYAQPAVLIKRRLPKRDTRREVTAQRRETPVTTNGRG
ncbi:MAG: hypothetical protein R3247_02790 [Rhodothermales bacterium]|nr:hypothetical protein [Rhodothermales bacterium]